MLSSKDVLERTGISRATLNNYIAAGLVARPDVLPPGPDDGGAPRLGYFPDDTVERIETIQRLKREGWSLGRIVEYFARGGEPQEESAPVPSASPAAAARPAVGVPAFQDSLSDVAAPHLGLVAVLAIGLHDAEGLWAQLSVDDYFEVMNQVAGRVRRVVEAHGGTALRASPHRFLCHFLPGLQGPDLWTALEAAAEVQAAIAFTSTRWKLKRGWTFDIEPHAALAAGDAWISVGPADDLQIVGDVASDALQLARCTRGGSLLLTRDFVSRLAPPRRTQLVYGIPEAGQAGGPPKRLMAFGRLRDVAPAHGVPRRIAEMPVTEFVDFRTEEEAGRKDPQ